MRRVCLFTGAALVLLFCPIPSAFAVDGWATMNGGTTGGAAGDTVTVDNLTDFEYYAESASPYIIQVFSGNINIGSSVNVTSNKTIRGIDSNSTLTGQLGFQNGSSNIIIERLNITNPDDYGEGDGISMKSQITNVFVTKCTIYECTDGCLDITNASDYVTVSWCKFYYTNPNNNHRYVNLIGSSDNPDPPDAGKLKVTMHHNWWSTMCHERMPRVRFGQIHVYNNYYDCQGNNYCIRPTKDCQILAENNYFNQVDEPIEYNETGALVEAHDNIFYNCTNEQNPGTDDVFDPPYSYTLDNAADVPAIVTAGAGNIVEDYPPAAPTDLVATAGDGIVWLDWNDNNEADLDGYEVYRSTTSGGSYVGPLNGSLLSSSHYTDNDVNNGTTYYYVVTAVDASLNESDDSNEVSASPSIAPGAMGTVLREWWTGISGSSVSDLTSDPNFPDNPAGSNQLTCLEAPTDWADSYGTRISGYLHPPTSGSYTFWIASDDNSELWLSTNGDPDNATMIANVSGYTDPRQWDKYPSQQSSPISLSAGQKYYIEVLHKENASSDNLAVAWEGPGISQQVIYGIYLSPWFVGLYGDSTGNGIVDMNDLPDFIAIWLEDDCAESSGWDLDGDCVVNFYEYSMLAGNWM